MCVYCLDTVSAGRCKLCFSEDWNTELGVQNFPHKPMKKAPRVERTLVCVLHRRSNDGETHFLLTQRPSKGIRPSVEVYEDASYTQHIKVVVEMLRSTNKLILMVE